MKNETKLLPCKSQKPFKLFFFIKKMLINQIIVSTLFFAGQKHITDWFSNDKSCQFFLFVFLCQMFFSSRRASIFNLLLANRLILYASSLLLRQNCTFPWKTQIRRTIKNTLLSAYYDVRRVPNTLPWKTRLNGIYTGHHLQICRCSISIPNRYRSVVRVEDQLSIFQRHGQIIHKDNEHQRCQQRPLSHADVGHRHPASMSIPIHKMTPVAKV